MFERILIANRGEIAVRIARTCRELGVEVVAIHSDADAGARFVAHADHAVHLPGVAPADTYLNIEAVVDAAIRTGSEAVHPGYGFLSERAEAAQAVEDAGLVWIGPSPDAIRAAGDKVQARRLADGVGVPPVPGTLQPVATVEEVVAFGDAHGFPVAIKAAGGGGGRGLRVAGSAGEVAAALESAVREAEAYFGSGQVYLERYLPHPKHIEVQVVAPRPGGAIWLGARDCSVQRRHQKLIEETPPPLFADLIPTMGQAAVGVADACGYENAGTVEFLIDVDASRFYFLEINARLQVEHPVTEEVLGIDLVAAQLRIAAGEPVGFDQADVTAAGRLAPRGHAIECRINAEDPSMDFLPRPGRIDRFVEPGGPGIRVDSGFRAGDEVPAAYDSLLAKLIAWGETREEARRRMLRALDEFGIAGIPTTIPAHRVLLAHPDFVDGSYTTRLVESGALASLAATRGPPEPSDGAVLMVEGTAVRLWNPAMAGSAAGASRVTGGAERGAVVAPMHGTILKVLVAEGDEVRPGDPVAVLEAMKMETELAATAAGTVASVAARSGDVVEAGQLVVMVR
jgi:acetyl-CoA/propionyl-CoA/long-chain acyl-CoA carboxylase, biotin carboxylase, biotin carboxyl carrier protein